MGLGNILKLALGAVGGPVGLAAAGIGALGGALEGKKSARTSTSDITPTLAPEYNTLAGLLRSRAEDQLRNAFDTSGLTANGISGINQVFQGLNQNASNNLTARGLATSPIAGVVGQNLNLARGGEITNFLNNLPLLQNNLAQSAISGGLNVANLGRGQHTEGVGPGSAAGGAFSSAAEMLAYLTGRGSLGNRTGTQRL